MNGYLLDTHSAIWFFNGDNALSAALEALPLIHRDPFDSLLIATALAEQMTLITVDENIAKYDVPQIW